MMTVDLPSERYGMPEAPPGICGSYAGRGASIGRRGRGRSHATDRHCAFCTAGREYATPNDQPGAWLVVCRRHHRQSVRPSFKGEISTAATLRRARRPLSSTNRSRGFIGRTSPYSARASKSRSGSDNGRGADGSADNRRRRWRCDIRPYRHKPHRQLSPLSSAAASRRSLVRVSSCATAALRRKCERALRGVGAG